MGRQVALGVVALVRVSSAPLKPAGGQLVGCQGTGPGSETKKKIINQKYLEKWKIFNQRSIAKRDKHKRAPAPDGDFSDSESETDTDLDKLLEDLDELQWLLSQGV